MKKLTALFLCLTMLLSGFAFAEEANDVWATLEEAYIYVFPLVLMDATKTSATNTETVVCPAKRPSISSCTALPPPTPSSRTL